MYLAAFVMLTSVLDLEADLQVEIERRLAVLPASEARKATARVELQAAAKNFENPPQLLPLSKTETSILRQLVYRVGLRNRSLIKAIIFNQELGEISDALTSTEFWQLLNSYSWMGILEVYKNLEPNEEYLKMKLGARRAVLHEFVRRRLLDYVAKLSDEYGDSGVTKLRRLKIRSINEGIQKKYGRPLGQREIEVILRLMKFRHYKEPGPKNLSVQAQDLLARSWQQLTIRSLRDKHLASPSHSDEGHGNENLIGRFIDALEHSEATWLEKDAIWDHARGLSYRQIAESYGLPLGTVKSAIHRGRKVCKEILADLESESPKHHWEVH